MSLLSAVGRRIERALWETWRQIGRPTTGIGIACSGGIDSQVLLHACSQLSAANPLFPAPIVLHFDHQIRADSSAVARFVKDEAERLALEFHTGVADGTLETSTRGLEEAARAVRYEWLQRIAEEHRLKAILMAHHGNDQIETVGLGLLRGGRGGAAVHGMPPVRELGVGKSTLLARPFLELSQSEVCKWAQDNHIACREDLTNTDTRFARNSLRHETLPALAEKLQGIDERLLKLSRDARSVTEDSERLLNAAMAHSQQGSCNVPGTEQVTWCHSRFRELPESLAHLLLTTVAHEHQNQQCVMTQKAMNFVLNQQTGSHELSRSLHLTINVDSDTLTLRRRVPLRIPDPVPLSIPGSVCLPNDEGTFRATVWNNEHPPFGDNRQFIPLGHIVGSLQVRSALTDETMTPFGSDQPKPILEILQDGGVPSHARRARVGLADAQGMLWYPGVRASERCRVGNEKALIALSYQGPDSRGDNEALPHVPAT